MSVETYTLYGGMPPHVDTETSRAAARRAKGHVGIDRYRIISDLVKHRQDGRTCDEIEIDLQMRHQTASARIRELFLQNQIVGNDFDTRPTRSGSQAIIWRLKKNALAR